MRSVAFAIAALVSSTTPWAQSSPIRPIMSLVATDNQDLAFLKPLLDGVRIVQLGEAGHGMGATEAAALFLDIDTGVSAGMKWLRSPVPARFDGRLEQRLVAADQYDGLIVLRRVSPPAFLY